LSLNPNGSEDHLLKIKDLPNITVGDYNLVPINTANELIVILNNDIANETIEVDDTKVKEALLYTKKENKEGITVEEDLDDVTTDTGDELNDYDLESSFDEEQDGDEQNGDCDM
jgi:hypothetical protein